MNRRSEAVETPVDAEELSVGDVDADRLRELVVEQRYTAAEVAAMYDLPPAAVIHTIAAQFTRDSRAKN